MLTLSRTQGNLKMKLGKRFGIVAAMEELEEELAPVEAAPEFEDTSESVEAGVAEVNENADVIENNEAAVDDVAIAADELTDIADTVETAGELDETSAAITEVAVESLYRRLGITRRKPMPALESFGSTSNRKKATKLALEEWKETISKAWEAVKKFFLNIWEYIVKFWKFCTEQATRIESKAKEMLAAAAKLGALADDKKSIPAGKWATDLMVGDGGAVDAEGALTVIANETIKALKASEEISSISSILDEIAKRDIDKAIKDADLLISGAVNGFKKLSSSDKGVPSVAANVEVHGTEILPNGSRIIIERSLTEVKVSMVDAAERKAVETVPTLDHQQVKSVLTSVTTNMSGFRNSKKQIEEMNKVISAFKSKDSLLKKNFGEDKEQYGKFGEAVKRLRAVGKVATTPVNMLNKASINTCNAALNYCAASMKQYSGSTPALPAPAPAAA